MSFAKLCGEPLLYWSRREAVWQYNAAKVVGLNEAGSCTFWHASGSVSSFSKGATTLLKSLGLFVCLFVGTRRVLHDARVRGEARARRHGALSDSKVINVIGPHAKILQQQVTPPAGPAVADGHAARRLRWGPCRVPAVPSFRKRNGSRRSKFGGRPVPSQERRGTA